MALKIPRYVEVAVPLPLRRLLTYEVPDAFAAAAGPGVRAVVPVGRRLLTGVIVAHAAEAPVDPGRIKQVAELLDPEGIVPADLMNLALWAARYYVAPPGAMVSSLLPPGIGRRSAVRVTRTQSPAPELGLGAREADLLARIPEGKGIALARLASQGAALRRLQELGLVHLEMAIEPARVSERHATWLRPAPGQDLAAALASIRKAPRQRALLELVASRGEAGLSLEEANDRLGSIVTPARALVARGTLRWDKVESLRAPVIPQAASPQAAPEPTRAQAAVLSELLAAQVEGTHRAFLLMGVTGSGKTEVYLRAMDRCLASGAGALYMVPEIALTPLLARNLKARLGSQLAILHSSLSPGERFDEWRRVRRGDARIVLGARSAIFAPLAKVGLIVVDEEQDGSYKQEEDPRYNARDLALVRGRDAGAVVLLGSATPSIESFHAASGGRYTLLRLPERILARPMARVRLVDMRAQTSAAGKEPLLSDELREAVTRALARGGQAILLLNRRGYAPWVQCRSCGESERCRNCSLTLTWHRADGAIRCHYCGYQRGTPRTCSTCRSDALLMRGAGTERLEDHLIEIFPEARIARLDRDTARGRRRPAEILSAFERGETNLLVGTQMVAKGHDFPGVTIVGVIGADAALNMPDFRAAERTFQLLTQVAGRAGRGDEPGEVVVQAWQPDHYAIQAAARQDYAAFYEMESRFRRAMRYPPFCVMANLIVQASLPETGVRRARQVADAVRQAGGSQTQVIGPAAAPLARLKGRYRYQVIVKGASRRKLSDALNEAASALAVEKISTKDLVIDMDPVTLI
jgi:primosomal protein N' (replication factor Y)